MNVGFRIFEEYSASRLCFRKYHQLKHLVLSILMHACPHIYSSEADEAAHKEGPKVRSSN